jgi:hypothetical protein
MMRQLAIYVAVGIAEVLVPFDLDAWWLNHGPGHWFIRFGYARRIALMEKGVNHYRWDIGTNTVTNVLGGVRDRV